MSEEPGKYLVEQPKQAVTGPAGNGKAHDVLAIIERLATTDGVDVDKFERLIALQERAQAEGGRREFFAAMSEFQSECPALPKTKSVRKTNGEVMYSYAPLEAVQSVIRPFEAKHGFHHGWTQENAEGGGVRIVCTVRHIGGHSESTHAEIPATKGMNTNAAQDRGIEIKYGQRLSLQMAYGLCPGGEDYDGNAAGGRVSDPLDDGARAELSGAVDAYCKRLKRDRAKVIASICTEAGCKSLDDFPRAAYGATMKLIGGAR